jgi:hypothetical protein
MAASTSFDVDRLYQFLSSTADTYNFELTTQARDEIRQTLDQFICNDNAEFSRRLRSDEEASSTLGHADIDGQITACGHVFKRGEGVYRCRCVHLVEKNHGMVACWAFDSF